MDQKPDSNQKPFSKCTLLKTHVSNSLWHSPAYLLAGQRLHTKTTLILQYLHLPHQIQQADQSATLKPLQKSIISENGRSCTVILNSKGMQNTEDFPRQNCLQTISNLFLTQAFSNHHKKAASRTGTATSNISHFQRLTIKYIFSG